jgi:hypothetical protein
VANVKTSDQLALELAQHHQALENEIKMLRYKSSPQVLKAQLRDVIGPPALLKGVINMVNPLNNPNVKEHVHQAKDAAQTLASDVKDTVSATAQTVKDGVTSAVTQVKDAVTGDTVREVTDSATDAVKQGFASAKAFVHNRAEKVKDGYGSVKEKVGSAAGNIRQGTHRVQTSVSEHPWTTALIASGAALTAAGIVMWASSSRHKRQPYEVKEQVDGFIDEGNPNVGEGFIEDDSTYYAEPGQPRDLTQVFHHQPLLIGSAAMLLGAAIGALLPRSTYENRMVGEASEAGQEVKETVLKGLSAL